MKYSELDLKGIHDLLHDASLNKLTWDTNDQISLDFATLRENTDDTSLPTNVVIRFERIDSIYTYHQPFEFWTSPSELEAWEGFELEHLKNWNFPQLDATVWVNSKQTYFNFLTCQYRKRIFGKNIKEAKSQFLFFMELGNHASLLFCCNDFSIWSNGEPLSIAHWEKQNRAWWDSWAKYWEKKKDSETDPVAEKETIIPLSASSLEDSRYNPPDKPVLQVGNTECPEALLSPIRNYHEGILRQDWEKVRQAWPNFDLDAAAHLKQIKESYLGIYYGNWMYIRQVDNWWIHEKRAAVTCRGIEHFEPDEEDPVFNMEVVISYDLRNINDQWYIWTHTSKGVDAEGEKEWYQDWDIKRD